MSLPSYSSSGSGSLTPSPYVPPAAPQPYLPNASWTLPVAPRESINEVASAPEDQQLQVSASNAPLRVIYGPARVGAQLADALTYQGKLILLLVWGEGEIEAIDALEMNDAALPAGVIATHYTGTAGQTADPTLVAAYASHGITYTDTLAGIAYSVASVTESASAGFPTFAARIRGRKLYDPRTTLTAYSDCPALALADLESNTTYGFAKDVIWSSVSTVANDNDELVGTEKRRLIGLVCDTVGSQAQWTDTLRTYASCFVVQADTGLKFISDRPGTSVFSFGPAGDSKIVGNTLKLKKRGVQNVPTVMRIQYTDTTTTPWSTGTAEVLAAGVEAGTVERRESTVSLPGIQRYSQAYREAVERINKLTLGDLTADFVAFDEALAVEVGDIADLTSSLGLTAKLIRVGSVSSASPGRPRISATEYDPAMYSDIVQSEPTYTDTTLPNPAVPPALSYLYAWEEVFQMDNGTWSSRIRVFWLEPSYTYIAEYRIEVYQAGVLVNTGSARAGTMFYTTPAVKEGVEYVVKVAVVTTIGSVGAWSQTNLIPLGKYLVPGNVATVTTFEVGGTVYVSWTPAVDIDIWRYEVRRGLTTETWDDATLIDRVDALRLTTSEIAAGTWRIFVKALDSVGQYSTTAAYSDVTVTSDANSFFVDSYDQTSPTLTNMASFTLARTDPATYYVSEDGVMAATKFPLTASSYANIAATYQASQTCTWLGEATDDFGQVLSGQWTGTATVEALAGTLTSYLGLSDDGAAWAYTAGLSQLDTGRFARLKHETLTTSVMKVTVPTQNIRLDAIPREEVGSGTSSATLPTTITLDNVFTAVKSISITASGTAARIAVYDNIVMGNPSSFDVYVFDSAGVQVACDFLYSFRGV